MKRNRKLKSFHFKGIGIMNNDFIQSLRTCVIYYTLKGQKIRRIWYFQMNEDAYCDLIKQPKLFANFIYTNFKTSLNIKHT